MDIQIPRNVITNKKRKEKKMLQIHKKEMLNIKGGASLSSTIINSINKAVNTVYMIGQSIGSSIRRIISGNLC